MGSAALARDVVQMMDRVVDEVARERRDGERRSVAAGARAMPLVALHAVEALGDGRTGRLELVGDDNGVLAGVVVLEGGRVLVPVGEAADRSR